MAGRLGTAAGRQEIETRVEPADAYATPPQTCIRAAPARDMRTRDGLPKRPADTLAAHDEVRALARQNTVKASNRRIEFMDSESELVGLRVSRARLSRWPCAWMSPNTTVLGVLLVAAAAAATVAAAGTAMPEWM